MREEEWRPEAGADILRRHPLRRLASPIRERRFTYRSYDAFLDRLEEASVEVVTLRELASGDSRTTALVALRHDVDDRLESALHLGELEHAHGVRATYFLLHSAGYYSERGRVLAAAERLQQLGHEIGWHNDLVTLDLVDGIDPVAYLNDELGWLRSHGIAVSGVSAHGSLHCHRLGYTNDEFFVDNPAPSGLGFRRARLADFGLEYDAGHLGGAEHYWSDATFDRNHRRWHPDRVVLDELRPGDRAVVLVHPCHWDASMTAKIGRVLRAATRATRARAPRAATPR